VDGHQPAKIYRHDELPREIRVSRWAVKNQYFGDINDFRKYGLLRALGAKGNLSIAVCWMLTPDDGRSDGRFVQYLQRPEQWQPYDPELFDQMRYWVVSRGARDIHLVEKANLIPGARYHAHLLSDDAKQREEYFQRFWTTAEGCDLVFFDPDNGVEVKSKPYGQTGSAKYLYWRELVTGWEKGYSVLVYQHFRREQRSRFMERMARTMQARTGAATVYAFHTSHVVFFLLPALARREIFEQRIGDVAETWNGQIEVST
jgi:hypothetical protein